MLTVQHPAVQLPVQIALAKPFSQTNGDDGGGGGVCGDVLGTLGGSCGGGGNGGGTETTQAMMV